MRVLTIFISAILFVFSGVVVSAADSTAPHWSYSGHDGPEYWGELSPKFHACSSGRSQSPIDIARIGGSTDGIVTNYRLTALDVLNNGHTIQLNYEPGSTLMSEGREYELLQFHFHSPSEHTIEGRHFPLEVHLVHKDDSGKLAVVGVMFREGQENPDLAALWNHMPENANTGYVSSDLVNASNLLPSNLSFVRYNGSLTTPPCSEGVRWHVVAEPLEASAAQIDKFLSVVQENNRPIQARNKRLLEKHTE
ncbi:carbonic anhydrase [Emcibacter sp.]|uniref:carbonic anhydrase n=1 Tax=Emcibacter sp. TaxID=1979954 RepID=UPI003A9543CD